MFISFITVNSPFQVERVPVDNLTFKDFFYKYALTSTPVIVTGVVDKMTTVPWTQQHIADIAGKHLSFHILPVHRSLILCGTVLLR